jgi:hypothetical protein
LNEFDESPVNVVGLINSAMSSSDDHKVFFRYCYIIFKSQGKDSWVAECEDVLGDVEFSKVLGFLGGVKANPETSIMYYGRDKGLLDPLVFREDDERRILDVEVRFLRYLGIILKELDDDEGFAL